MKRLFAILALVFVLPAFATDRVTVTLTLTNTPAYPNTFVQNAKTITWTNATAGAPSTSVLIGASVGASATNLFRQLSSYPLTGPVSLGFSSSNVITIQGAVGQAMTASISGTYGYITLSTQTVSVMTAVRVPITGEPTASTRTNIASLLSTNIGILSTNALAMYAGIILPYQAGITNGIKIGSTVINSDGFGYPILVDTATYTPHLASLDGEILNLYSAKATFPQKDVIVTNTWYSTNIFGYMESIGAKITAGLMVGGGATNFTSTNSTMTGTNTISGFFVFPRANHTSLANGNNAGVTFTGYYNKVKAGPTAAFTICGIAGGQDGREILIDNSIAQNMTIANDSGVDATAANRIYTRTGADVTTTGQGVARLIYDSEDSRWILISIGL